MYHYDSRQIKPNDIFICLPGGEPFIEQAKQNGASEVLKMDRYQMAKLAADHYGHPSKQLTVVGITGTNGKTTVANLVHDGLTRAGYYSQYLGTINSKLTTPESLDLQRLMAEHLQNGGTHFVMEVSSHGIDQSRINGIHFAVKLLTNITEGEHLDYHKTFTHYKQTKLKFMSDPNSKCIFPSDFKQAPIDFAIPLLGEFNIENVQAASLVLAHLKIDPDIIKESMMNAKAPIGRFEPIDMGQDFMVIIDFAHTPDALDKVLGTAKSLAQKNNGRLLVTFGCGGDRDRSKRPTMGKIVNQWADYFIITQDNPRSEDENQIIQDICTGIAPVHKPFEIIPDRGQAIKELIRLAQAHDVLMITGKGHETYQILKDGTIHFDDREEAQKALRELISAGSH